MCRICGVVILGHVCRAVTALSVGTQPSPNHIRKIARYGSVTGKTRTLTVIINYMQSSSVKFIPHFSWLRYSKLRSSSVIYKVTLTFLSADSLRDNIFCAGFCVISRLSADKQSLTVWLAVTGSPLSTTDPPYLVSKALSRRLCGKSISRLRDRLTRFYRWNSVIPVGTSTTCSG
jgi:hypothetical protein